MSGTHEAAGAAARPRYLLVDAYRGLAIVGVVIYHLFWDLRYFGFITTEVESDIGWLIFARSLLVSFMFLTGVSLVLAHGRGIRWSAFWRREAIIAGSALLITIGTYIVFPEAFVYFGVLHAIALSSLLALPFLRLPPILTGLAGLAIIVAAFAFSNPVFTQKPLSWIGFWIVPPYTNDLVPVFPYFGVVLVGVSVAALVLAAPVAARIAGFAAAGPVGRFLVMCGRWSLVIYLVHQLVWFSLLTPLAGWLQPGAAARAADFVGSCVKNCEIGAGEPGFCQRYCQCSLEQIEKDNLWGAVSADPPDAVQQSQINQVVKLCSAMGDVPPSAPPVNAERQ